MAALFSTLDELEEFSFECLNHSFQAGGIQSPLSKFLFRLNVSLGFCYRQRRILTETPTVTHFIFQQVLTPRCSPHTVLVLLMLSSLPGAPYLFLFI